METTNAAMDAWLNSSDSKEYFELIKFPTVAAETLHLRDAVQCAMWLKKWLEKIGAEAELLLPQTSNLKLQTPTSIPVVYGEIKGEEGAPAVLVYGHYDVQPADPLDKWESDPFVPTVKGERVYARGAQDDKGQFFAFLCGVREFLGGDAVRDGTRTLPSAGGNPRVPRKINLKFLLEGQEESGSGTLFKLLEDHAFRKRLAADILLVSDTSAAEDLRPAIVAGLRGVNHFTVKLTAANRDLHSGEYGGIAPNAAQGMAELMASLHNADGSIAVSGFRDGIVPPTHEELEAAEAGFPNEEAFAADIGTQPAGGQRGKTLVQRNGFEPTIEINGIHSGYGGPGSKTVIPCEAIAKLSTRLVPGQNPQRTFDAIKTHLKDRCPRGMTLSFPEDSGLSAALRLPLASPLFRLAEDLLTEMDVRGPVFLWDGASIPVVSALKDASCAAPLLVGWGQSEDRIHSPNESFSLRQFSLAKDWAKRILEALCAMNG